jgi:CheY-like chemotaxis protein
MPNQAADEDVTTTVLVVDDDQAIRAMLKTVLEAEGYRVWTLTDGARVAEALHTAAAPCVVLLDLMMPGVSGWDVCAQLAADPRHARHAVAVMTAGLLKGDAVPAPARFLLPKPFDLDRLYAAVAGLAAGLVVRPAALAVAG